MPEKKYNEFPAGTYDTSKIFLQANSIDGSLEKVNLPVIQGLSINIVRCNFKILGSFSAELLFSNTGNTIIFTSYGSIGRAVFEFQNPLSDSDSKIAILTGQTTYQDVYVTNLAPTNSQKTIQVGLNSRSTNQGAYSQTFVILTIISL